MTFSFERTAFWPVQSRKKSLEKTLQALLVLGHEGFG
jgi:hypothetical protein